MKPALFLTAIASLSLAVLSGCAASQPEPQTAVASYDEPRVVVPDPLMQPPGAMEVSWTPTAAPVKAEAPARPLDAKPEFVAPKKNARGHLFVIPKHFDHE